MSGSIGDFVAIAGVIERIVTEVKAFNEAPLQFQRLAIELDFLSKVCHQVFELRPSNAEDLAQLERIRAIALHCLGPLKDFENKMKGYESALSSGSEPKSKSGNWSRVKKRLHWSAIARHEVDELRAILTSELLAINSLLSLQRWYLSHPYPCVGVFAKLFQAGITSSIDFKPRICNPANVPYEDNKHGSTRNS